MGFRFPLLSFRWKGALWAWLALGGAALAVDISSLCADRAAIERVYYAHRLGEKPPFEQTLPTAAVESLVRQDLRKEAVLRQAYGIEVTPAMIGAEVLRINTTTRAPDILAELKAALGNDQTRFAQTVARPMVAERLLRERFDNDDKIHAGQRRKAEQVRNELLATKAAGNGTPPPDKMVSSLVAILKRAAAGQFTEMVWQLAPETKKTDAPQTLSLPNHAGLDQKFYFEDLPAELQRVLQAQLRHGGDVSAVIETSGGFLVYVCKQKTAETLATAVLSLPKMSCETWLAEQDGGKQ